MFKSIVTTSVVFWAILINVALNVDFIGKGLVEEDIMYTENHEKPT